MLFVHAIEVAEFLLFEKLGSVFGGLSLAVLSVLARAIGTLLELFAGLKKGEVQMARFASNASSVFWHSFCFPFFDMQSLGVSPVFPGVRASA